MIREEHQEKATRTRSKKSLQRLFRPDMDLIFPTRDCSYWQYVATGELIVRPGDRILLIIGSGLKNASSVTLDPLHERDR